MSIPPTVIDLVERFERNIESYKFGNYNEQQTRYEFISPFFEALGWDVSNKQGYAEAYKDVIHEYSQKTADSTEAPDYLFRIGSTRKFFVEAKKPSVKLADDISPAYQLRRYAWTAKLPLSILTDFEEFAVYDCRIKPNKNDKPSFARVNYYHYKDYVEKWEEIASVFSKDSVLKGSFDKYAEINKAKRGTAEVDDAFLKEIEHWRDILAKNIAIRNPKLTNRELNFAVQKTIDRIIFLRICEDRGIEDYGQLMSLQNGVNVYIRMMQIFNRADEKYNSGLFHFEDEKGRIEPPDIITPKLKIDDKTLKDIIKNLYYPDSPYEFSVLPADILGHVYEQFLGKVIRLTPSHQAKIDEKPEVKKAGGVYYTPTYIVDYIVKNTVGKLLPPLSERGETGGFSTLSQVSKLKILDPACGSGSFLLGAYQYLLDWHLQYYLATQTQFLKKGKVEPLSQNSKGEWKLTTAERKRILLNNIYGVDIDPQAVEVTKLSLLLKVLEGETDETLASQLKFFHERALPDLSNNIKCGNSLIGPDFYDGQLFVKTGYIPSLQLDDEERMRINVFDWNEEFKDVMSGGGFDVVIGNPPYVRIQVMKEWAKQEVEFYKTKYHSASKGNYDLYVVFAEKGLELVNQIGFAGFILPNKFLLTDYGEKLRELLSSKKVVDTIIDFGSEQIFKNSTTYTCLLFLNKVSRDFLRYVKVVEPKAILSNKIAFSDVNYSKLSSNTWMMNSSSDEIIIEKLFSDSVELGSLPAKISRGSSTGNDNVFMLNEDELNDLKIEDGILINPIFATDFNRYSFNPQNKVKLIFPYEFVNEKYVLINENILSQEYPNAYEYLHKKKKELEKRKQYSKWFGYSALRNLLEHTKADILIPLLANSGIYTIFDRQGLNYTLMASGGFSIWILNSEVNPLFVLGLINSKLLFWYLSKLSNDFRGGWITCTKQYFEKLPIKKNSSKISSEKIIEFVKQITALNQKTDTTKIPTERTAIERQIEATDKQIDQLVYQLYGLTTEEIKIVEESVK